MPRPGNANWTPGSREHDRGLRSRLGSPSGLSVAPGRSTWEACDLSLDCAPTVLVLPKFNLGQATTDVAGAASIKLVTPAADPGLTGF